MARHSMYRIKNRSMMFHQRNMSKLVIIFHFTRTGPGREPSGDRSVFQRAHFSTERLSVSRSPYSRACLTLGCKEMKPEDDVHTRRFWQQADQDSYTAPKDIARLWVHECERVFRDRIISAPEMEVLDSMMAEAAKKHLSELQV